MDDESLTTEFFEWVDSNEDNFDFPICFESLENGVLTFQIDSYQIVLQIPSAEPLAKTTSSNVKSACETFQERASPGMSIQEQLDLLLSTYQEIKDFEDEDVDEYESHMMEVDTDQTTRQIRGDSFADKHFIFRQAEEAASLLRETFSRCPDLEFSLNVHSNPTIYNIRLEINLAFLSILDRTMVILGLTFDHPLVISLSLEPNFLLQSMDTNEWNRSAMGGFSVEVYQGGISDSYACKTYIPGRIHKFLLDMGEVFTKHHSLPSFLAIAKGSSTDPHIEASPDVVPELLENLLNMGYPYDKSVEALIQCQNNIDLTIDMLESQADNDTVDYFGELNNCLISTTNLFYNMIFYLRDRLQNSTNYCIICYKKHPSECVRMRPCSKEICEFRFEEISGVSIYAETKNNPNLVMLDLSFAAEAAFSHRACTVFEPFPSFLLKSEQLRGKSGFLDKNSKEKYTKEMDQNKDMESLLDTLRKIPDPINLVHSTNDEDSVIEYFQKYCQERDHDCAKLYKYIIATNRLALLKLEETQKIKNIPSEIDQYIVTNHPPETHRTFEEKKHQHGSFFAFHGSALENWYSILRNGIRNLSHTHMMTAGAARGAGVYTAENVSTSAGYSRLGNAQNAGWPHSILQNSGCLAIVEIINNQQEYKSSGGIYVVHNDSDLIIRYLLVFRSMSNMNFCANNLKIRENLTEFENSYHSKEIQDKKARICYAIEKAKKKKQEDEKYKFLTQKAMEEEEKKETALDNKIERITEAFSGHGSAMSNKRIMQEYKYLVKSKECKGLAVEFEGDSNMYIWIVSLNMDEFEVNKELKADFEKYSKQYKRPRELVFEVRFDSNFPYNPPFVRVIRPRFQFRTGHITIGGSICMESLTPSGWIPVRTIESIFIEILYNVAEGGARLDLGSADREYSLGEAQEAFNRVARQHNWI